LKHTAACANVRKAPPALRPASIANPPMSDLAYPRDVAAFILDRWPGRNLGTQPISAYGYENPPSAEALERLILICFEASLLREELRPVTFRVVLAEPDLFPLDQGPPDGLHCLQFSETRPFNALEARRLSPAANFYRSLIGVCLDEKREMPRMWGILHSGLRWLQNAHGGRGRPQMLPAALVLSVTGPGRLTLGFGSEVIARMEGGRIAGPSANVLEAQWMRAAFAPIREEMLDAHVQTRQALGAAWATLDPMLARIISQHAIKRLISALRTAHHGATIVMLPPEMAARADEVERYIALKYRFADGEPRQRFRTLVTQIMNRVAELHAGASQPVGWAEYALSTDECLSAFDEAIFEMAYLVAGCAEVDGAVVLTKRFELLGFGGEISGELPGVVTVRRALDLEGVHAEEEFTESVGTRHRSAYRLCLALPNTLAIVVSQDGTVRFVTNREGAVTYWDHSSTTSLDV
jgi:hypothetical protein